MATKTDNTSSAVVPFLFEGDGLVRVVKREGEAWFVAADVCKALSLKPHRGSYAQHVEKLDPDEKLLADRGAVLRGDPITTGLNTGVAGELIAQFGGYLVHADDPLALENAIWLVSESGLYALILRSRTAMTPGTAQHRFRKWVTAEVLPTIRKTGGYRAQPHRGLTEQERAEQTVLAKRRMRVNEMHAATRALEALRRSSGSRAAALAAPQIYAALGVNIDPDASDTLAQGEPTLGDTVH